MAGGNRSGDGGMSLPTRVAIGTMHGKEAAFGPPLAALGVALILPEGLDTDRFGTFTGEVPRAGDMAAAARAKAEAARRITGLDVALASEGAYGPHPTIPFLAAGIEIALWQDATRGHEIIERIVDERPAFDHALVADMAAAETFLARVGFPHIGLIVAPATQARRPLAKGLRDATCLEAAIAEAARASGDGCALVQTDMRAHMNPRRMEVLGRLARRLAERLGQSCPACGARGWGMLRTETGLLCAWCGLPTRLVLREIHGCTACGHSAARPRRDGLAEADPGSCERCNP